MIAPGCSRHRTIARSFKGADTRNLLKKNFIRSISRQPAQVLTCSLICPHQAMLNFVLTSSVSYHGQNYQSILLHGLGIWQSFFVLHTLYKVFWDTFIYVGVT